jgi:hypothetical protein
MPLILKTVPPSQGLRWLRDGWRLFARYPLGFSVMFSAFLLAVLVASLVPLVGPLAMLAALPMLSLGFMVASESALGGGPVHPGQFLQPLRGDPARRRSLVMLCLAYGVAAIVVMLASDLIDDGAFGRLQRLLAEGDRQQEIDALVADPRLAWGLLVRFGLVALMSVPFWHAPALVHWGGQGPWQALFSSTLAVWRCKGAFVAYTLGWVAMVIVFGAFSMLMFSILGTPQLAGLVALPAALIFSTVFYVSLLFTFNDSFGGTGQSLPEP